MRIALIADVHANLAALDAALADARSLGAEAVWQMGDVVGYGPDPNEVVGRLVECGASGVGGNHDAAAVGELGLEEFNEMAADANRWTARVLTPESIEYLKRLPRVEVDGDWTRVHGTLRQPLWEYLTSQDAAEAHFALQTTRFSLVGHTHLPLALWRVEPGRFEAVTPEHDEVVELDGDPICLNPGGVGQPRDGEPRAPYALLDTSAATVTFRRVPYDIATTQARIREAGLPPRLAERLAVGR